MTERAQKVMEAFYQPMNRSSHYYDKFSVAAVIREIVNEHQYYQCCEEEGVEDMVVDARVLYELADELEDL
jgi:cytidine deaminase